MSSSRHGNLLLPSLVAARLLKAVVLLKMVNDFVGDTTTVPLQEGKPMLYLASAALSSAASCIG